MKKWKTHRVERFIADELREEIKWLEDQLEVKEQRVSDLTRQVQNMLQQNMSADHREPNKTKIKLKDYCFTISLDLWPVKDWFRLGYSAFNPGKYAQLTVGPLRVDWFVG